MQLKTHFKEMSNALYEKMNLNFFLDRYIFYFIEFALWYVIFWTWKQGESHEYLHTRTSL